MNTSESEAKTMELVVQLGLGLLLVAGHCIPATAAPSSACQMQCGDVKILYPFGIGKNCSLSGEFDVTCLPDQNGISKPSIGGHELLDISLTNGTIRVLNPITTYCYNDTWHFNSSTVVEQQSDNSTTGYVVVSDIVAHVHHPFQFSDTRNKFTVIGCTTLGIIGNTNDSEYMGGCHSTCGRNMSDGSSCSGTGCCQTPIPKGIDMFGIILQVITPTENQTNIDQINQTNRLRGLQCSYAVLMEEAAFSFSTTYVNTTKFMDMDAGKARVVLDWSIRNDTCEVAQRNLTGKYACLSTNSRCVDSTSGSPGYVCNCSLGYEGNPYLQDGCQDVDECNQGSPCPSDGVCHNTVGGYRCSCRAGRKYSEQSKSCVLDIVIVIGVTMGFLALMIFCFCGYMILQKRKLKNIKQEYFRQHGGLILFDTMKSEKGLAFTVFSEEELIHATNNYDKNRIIGKGGHGIVYKGIVKGNIPVAIKRCTLIDERQKKEFGKEMLILSQINHKNIVKLVGCCLEVEVPMLVYEFIPNGTSFQLIHGWNTLQISFSTLLRIAHEAAEGLNFLHSYASPPIIHGDVKTSNILLDENYMAKVSDFGASILAPSDKEQYVTLVQGTLGYLDPEYMQTCQLTEKSDVYSFGVILLEILTGEVPLKLYGPEEKRSLTSNFLSAMQQNDLCAMVASQIKEQESIELIRGLGELAQNCLEMCGSNRPSMKEVADELNRLRKLLPNRLNTEEMETGPADTSFQTENSSIEYPVLESQNLPMHSISSNYAR